VKSSLFCSPEKRNFVFCLLIFVFTLVVYNSLNRHRFVNYDDDRYVTENPHVRAGLSGDPIAGAFTSTEQANWHPLSWISHALDYQLFRLNPAGHHFTRVVLHAVNGALLFLIAVYATGRALPSLVLAFIVRASPHERRISGLVAERKNVLSTFFFFATLAAYAWYTRNPNRKRYLTVLFLFACGLMSKPMLVTLPFVLLLLDHWPLQRTVTIEKRIVEKPPLFALSVAIAIITMFAQQTGGAMPSSLQFPFGVRLENGIGISLENDLADAACAAASASR
jgi:protein O-mannosyl-transferase